jgi:hypothetical protein
MTERASALLVTGCYRSGTTLVEKLLNMHPSLTVASQPFPILYFLVKERFLEQRGLQRRYPLDHLFLERDYSPEQFAQYVEDYVITTEDVTELFDRMDAYTEGLWTPEMKGARHRVERGGFLAVRDQLLDFVDDLFPKANRTYVGSKEVLVEEFIPALVASGTHVVHVVRDPRAMIASLNFRERDNQTGDNRPILYSLRAWRKSAAYALAMSNSDGFVSVRYEDVALDSDATLRKIATSLAIEPLAADALNDGIVDQWGRPWQGNSSFSDKHGVSAESLQSSVERLPEDVVAYIETICRPELLAFGYAPIATSSFDPDRVANFVEPFASIHAKFESAYSTDPRRVGDEIRRWELLTAPDPVTDAVEARAWFICPDAQPRLRAAVTA